MIFLWSPSDSKSPGHFSVFCLILTMLWFGWSRLILRFLTLSAPFPAFGDHSTCINLLSFLLLKSFHISACWWYFTEIQVTASLQDSSQYSGQSQYVTRPIRNTDNSRCSGMKHLFTSWLLVFRHKERERHNFYYADRSYIVIQSTPCWTAWPRVKSQLTEPTNVLRIP